MWNVVNIHRSCSSPSPRKCGFSTKLRSSSHDTKPFWRTGRKATIVAAATSNGMIHRAFEVSASPRFGAAAGAARFVDFLAATAPSVILGPCALGEVWWAGRKLLVGLSARHSHRDNGVYGGYIAGRPSLFHA